MARKDCLLGAAWNRKKERAPRGTGKAQSRINILNSMQHMFQTLGLILLGNV